MAKLRASVCRLADAVRHRLDREHPLGCRSGRGDFFLVNVTYLLLCLEAVDRSAAHKVEPRARSMMRMRSLVTLAVFAAAGGVALRYPIGGMAMICLCLIVYLSPGAPGTTRQRKSLE